MFTQNPTHKHPRNERHGSYLLIALLAFGLVALLPGCAPIKPVPLTPFADGANWVVEKPLVYEIADTGRRVVVPEGFVTDFASIPRPLWPIYPRTGRYQFPAVVHDFLYWEQSTTREDADRIFLQGMKESTVAKKDRLIIFNAVRIGGSAAWNRNQEDKKKGLPRVIPSEYRSIPANTTWAEYRNYLVEHGVRP